MSVNLAERSTAYKGLGEVVEELFREGELRRVLPGGESEELPERMREIVGNFGKRLGIEQVDMERLSSGKVKIDVGLGDTKVIYDASVNRYKWNLSEEPAVRVPRWAVEKAVRELRGSEAK